MVLILYLVEAMSGAFVVEQSASSVMIEHDRFILFRAFVAALGLVLGLIRRDLKQNQGHEQ